MTGPSQPDRDPTGGPLPPAHDPWGQPTPEPATQPLPPQPPVAAPEPTPAPAAYPPPTQPPPTYPAAVNPAAVYPAAAYPAPARRGRTVLWTVGGVAVLCLIGCVGLVALGAVGGVFDRLGEGGAAAPTGSVPSGISATSTATAAASGPFENTPAATYPEGEAGITLPAAAAVPGFSAAQVADALDQVKQGLIAARLDPRMVLSRDSSGLLTLLAPDSAADIEADFAAKNFFSFATQVAPGHSLTGDGVRVNGRVTFRGAEEDDIRLLEVITNFVWVYPFAGERVEPGDHLVVVHDEVRWVFPVDADVARSSRGMWINEATGYASNIDCDLLDQSLLALGSPRFLPGGGDDDPDAVFDPNRSLDIEDTC